jgi:hypothetical protein
VNLVPVVLEPQDDVGGLDIPVNVASVVELLDGVNQLD